MANELQLRQSEKRDSAAIVNELGLYSPRRGTQIKKARRFIMIQMKVCFRVTKLWH
jgi:hypothetical protein